jgi:hypothetical protein
MNTALDAVSTVPTVSAVSVASLARERVLPVVDGLASLLPEPGLVRGRIVACTGPAATSVALSLVARATQHGSWLAVVGVPWLGIDAARELGVAVERLVAVDADDVATWAERVAVAVDGIELVLGAIPSAVPPGRGGVERTLTKLRRRVQARGAVLVVVTHRSATEGGWADLVVEGGGAVWEGLGDGHGHLRRRRLDVRVAGRRSPLARTGEVWLPGSSGAVEPAPPPVLEPVVERTG